MELKKKKKDAEEAKKFHPNWWDNFKRLQEKAKERKCKPHELKERYRYWILTRDTDRVSYPEHQERRCKGIASIKSQYLADERYPRINSSSGEIMPPFITYDMAALPFTNTQMRDKEFRANLEKYLEQLKASAFKHSSCKVFPADLQYNLITKSEEDEEDGTGHAYNRKASVW